MGLLTLNVLIQTISSVTIKTATINKVPQNVPLLNILIGIKSNKDLKT